MVGLLPSESPGGVDVFNQEKLRVLVCDDDSQRSHIWQSSIQQLLGDVNVEITAISTGDFARAVHSLHQRVKQSKGGDGSIPSDDAHIFDRADVVIIDSDLTPDSTTNIDADSRQAVEDHLVGEFGSNVAWLARNFSDAGVLVVVNHIHKARVFDLTMTRFSHLPADAYISADDVASSALWTGEIDGSFRPWSWPSLLRLSQMRAPSGLTLGSGVLESLGLTADEASLFDQRQVDRLSAVDLDLENLTLWHVARSATFGFGHQAGAHMSEERQLAIAIHGLRRWLDSTVVPAQNVFMDLPHLVQDRPWLLGEARGDVEGSNRFLAAAWLDTPTEDLLPEAFCEPAASIVGRSLWRVAGIIPDQERRHVGPDDLVFCEDTSCFSMPSDAQEFTSDIEGAFRSRFVRRLDGVSYSPARRLAV